MFGDEHIVIYRESGSSNGVEITRTLTVSYENFNSIFCGTKACFGDLAHCDNLCPQLFKLKCVTVDILV